MEQERRALTCEACGEKSSSLRRGRCSACYEQWLCSRPIGLGARCIVCFDRRRDHLRLVEYQGTWLPLCHNCAIRANRLEPQPASIEALRERLIRDRRWGVRRFGGRDSRVFPLERRQDERRANWHLELEWFDAAELIIEELSLEGEAPAGEVREPTKIINAAAESAESAESQTSLPKDVAALMNIEDSVDEEDPELELEPAKIEAAQQSMPA